ncbi:lipase 1-like isoform X2 [Harmonia axyridis]|uniref:lipase 1-like isoform X2 n=1 Tax=Harmonia axyridis TaxID=115357 RepID=UPI001E276B8A|nr:lipase 1-like isoform X2 [Harmonia axyridis]
MKYLCLVLFWFRGCFGLGLWETIFGPALGDGIDIQKMVMNFGYKLTEHEVVSETGNILVLHKIRAKRKNLRNGSYTPSVLIQHGLLGASDNWFLRGPDKDLPYLLSDAGYDVWLGNMRGNVYSRRHTTLNPDSSSSYWNFALHEIAYYDLPATIDYILDKSGQESLFFMGHSIGSTIALILCSLRPEYNKKILLHLALAPIAYVAHKPNLYHKFVFASFPFVEQSVQSKNIHEVFPRRKYFSRFIEYFCQDGTYFQKLCLMFIFNFVGEDYEQFNATLIPDFAKYYPAGTSLNMATNLYQMYTTGLFSAMDFGNKTLNMLHYQSDTPPSYNLSNVQHPITLYYSDGDYLVTKDDIDILADKLPNVKDKFKIPYQTFNHLDFMWAINSKKLLYDQLLLLLNKYVES